MPDKKTAYGIVMARLEQVEQERHAILSSLSSASEWAHAYNKGMRKAYRTICEDLEEHGLVDSPAIIQEEDSV